MVSQTATRNGHRTWHRRATVTAALVGSIAATAACHGGPHVAYVVTATVDAADAQPGDGVCEATSGVGDCTVRAAVQEANATDASTVVTIELGAGQTYRLTVAGTDQVGAVGDLDVTRDVAVVGNGSTISGHQAFLPVFEVHAGTLAVSGATVEGSAQLGPDGRRVGGAVLNHATVELTDVTLHGGAYEGGVALHQTAGTATLVRTRVTESGGGWRGPWAAIWIDAGALTVLDSEVAGNTPSTMHQNLDYAGIRVGAGARASVVRSTVADHDATIFVGPSFPPHVEAPGAGIASAGSVDVIRSTITGNGFDLAPAPGGTITVSGSAVGDCGGATSGGFNAISGSPCSGAGGATDVPVADLGLGPLAWNGGPTRTRLPLLTSAVLDSIPIGTPRSCDGSLGTDQRGEPQPVGGGCDRGSVERQSDDP